MSRRLDIELTSKRDDATWTWRAAGAKQPKGVVSSDLVGEAQVGDILKVEAEADLDGIVVTAVLRGKERSTSGNVLEILGSGREEPTIETRLAGRGARGGDRRDRGDRNDRGPRPGGDRRDRGPRPGGERGDRGPRSDAERRDGPRRGERPARPGGDGRPDSRSSRPASDRAHRPERKRPPVDARPRAKRLRAGRVHRRQAVQALSPELRPLAEVLLHGGVPSLRQAVDRVNELARAEGRTDLPIDRLVTLSEKLLPPLRAADWRDRAQAALSGMAELDLRDLRSVVVAADTQARDEEARALAEEIRRGLAAHVDSEHRAWLQEIAEMLAEGRAVRALRLSSRPPKAGAPLPVDLAERLTAAANEALSGDAAPDRWATVLDAVAFSPVRQHVVPTGVPEQRSDELVNTVKKLAERVPTIAAMVFPPAAPAALTPPPPPVPPPPPLV